MTKQSPFGLHTGEAILRLAETYPRVLDVLLESVQNSIDKNSGTIMIGINQKSRSISIRDDGDGVNRMDFEKTIGQVAYSRKTQDKLGRFGLGLISPLGKCEKFIFTSTPKSNSSNYIEWSFVTDELRKQNRISGIPLQMRPELIFSRNQTSKKHGGTIQVPWRTEVRIEKYTSDRHIGKVTIESLRDSVLDRFGTIMQRKKVVILVTITNENGDRINDEIRAKDFEGRKLPDTNIVDNSSGRTTFKLYIAKKVDKNRKGKVLVGEIQNDFRINFGTFNKSLPEACRLSEEVVNALKSGFFEGEILNENIKLHPNRMSFVANEALVGFCCSIENWFEQTGKNYFKEAKEQHQDERYQKLGIRSMKVFEAMLKDPKFDLFRNLIENFKKGSIGKGHVEQKGKVSDVTSINVAGNAGQKIKHTGNGDGGQEKEIPTGEEKKVPHLTVAGPNGSKRIIVRSSSQGLNLVHEVMEGSDKLWIFENETGTLRINVLHPLFQQCEDHGDKTFMRFTEYLMLQALTLESSPPAWSEHARLVFDSMNGAYVYMLINSDFLSGRMPTNSKKISDKPEN